MEWSKPKETDGNPFGPMNIGDYLPAWDDIPEEFKRHNGTPWNTIMADWFYAGLKDVEAYPKEGIDPKLAWAHLGTVLGSWAPKHEHKEAGVSWLMSLWFDEITYTKNKK